MTLQYCLSSHLKKKLNFRNVRFICGRILCWIALLAPIIFIRSNKCKKIILLSFINRRSRHRHRHGRHIQLHLLKHPPARFPALFHHAGQQRRAKTESPPAHRLHSLAARFSREEISMPKILVCGGSRRSRKSTQSVWDASENMVRWFTSRAHENCSEQKTFRINRYQNRRTKWKRQNQLRLEQLRYQNSLAKEAATQQEDVNICCTPLSNLTKKYSSCDFLSSAMSTYSTSLSSRQNCS